MIALAVGTGVGINTVMASKLGEGKKKEVDAYTGVGNTTSYSSLGVICFN